MSETAFQTQYRQEFIAGFEERQSLLRSCTITESVIKGNQAVFLVADSGGATAVTRGVNGLIPSRADNNNTYTATLAEWHDKVRKTDFNIFASQGDQRRIMQETTMAVINRKVDADIISQLDTATIDTGDAATASVYLVEKSIAALGINEVPVEEEDNMFGLVTPGFLGYLRQTKEFSSGEYVDVKTFNGAIRKMWRWAGVNWIRHPNLTGIGTALEKCYLFHRNAIGHAVDTAGIDSQVGYDAEDKYSWARASMNMGSKLLQNAGVIQMKHDGSAFALS